MNTPLQSFFGLTFHPFHSDVPIEALRLTASLQSFLFRVEQQVRDGGFIAVIGDPGTGKSAALRLLEARLDAQKDFTVGVISRPQSNNADFYRELGHLFDVPLSPHNRWAGAKVLRDKWLEHVEQSRTRPVLIVDEAQEMKVSVLCELRILSSMNLDARALLTVVLGGDQRLSDNFRTPDMLPIASRIRARLNLDYEEPAELEATLAHLLGHAGRPDLITDDVKRALATHAHGNLRTMLTMADTLLTHAMERELCTIDEQCFFDVFQQPVETEDASAKKKASAKRPR